VIPLDRASREAVLQAARLEVGVRPEDVSVAPRPSAGAAEARVLVVEPMGNETIVTLEREGVRIVARAPSDLAAAPGAPLWFVPVPERALYFDAETGRRLG
jgi:multiple sugar transport system ATP-binding protein